MYHKPKLTPVLILVVISLLIYGPGAQINASAQEDVVQSKTVSPQEQDAALSFWTREAIAEAEPMGLMVQKGPAEIEAESALPKTGNDPVAFSPAGFAAADAETVARTAYAEDWAMAFDADTLQVDAPTGTSQVYTAYTVNQLSSLQTLYPHRWVGRLSFQTPSGTSYCSATSISGNVMLTAAHCLYDTTNNRWYSNWVFSPAYRNGSTPFGTFPATRCWILTSWVNLSGSFSINSWTRHDVGVCEMGTNSAGQTLNAAVGFMGRQWNYGYVRHFHDMGYPFRDYNLNLLPSAGSYLRTCVSESFQQTTDTLGTGCSYGPGISGGPWTINYAIGAISGYANSVNSGLFVGTQNIYGPRFNSSNIVPLCSAAGC
ncbi:MAG: trypsin-like serine peptidase [Chloroflexota bacterium]